MGFPRDESGGIRVVIAGYIHSRSGSLTFFSDGIGVGGSGAKGKRQKGKGKERQKASEGESKGVA